MILEPMTTNGKTIETKMVETVVDEDYLLTFSDGLGKLITHVKLKREENYDEWSNAIEMALDSKSKLGFINGHIAQPGSEDLKLKRWLNVNSMIGSWFLNTVERTLRSMISKSRIARTYGMNSSNSLVLQI